MSGLMLNLVLAVAWALFQGNFNILTLVAGFILGYVVIVLFRGALPDDGYVSRTSGFLAFAWFFVRELVIANVQVALLALRPHPPLKPVIVAVPLQSRRDEVITMLAATITLMPGTVAMGVSEDQSVMYVHAIGLPDARAARESVQKVEVLLLRFMAREAPPARAEREV